MLRVQVRLDGVLVDDRMCARGGFLGEADGAMVPFPGATLAVERRRAGWRVGGRDVRVGRDVRLDLGEVDIRVEAVPVQRLARPAYETDVRVLIATLAVMLSGASWQAARSVVERNPEASQQVMTALESWVEPVDAPRRAAIEAGDGAVGAGPVRPSESLETPLQEGLRRPPAVFMPSAPAHER